MSKEVVVDIQLNSLKMSQEVVVDIQLNSLKNVSRSGCGYTVEFS